jgi:hypothetical protein
VGFPSIHQLISQSINESLPWPWNQWESRSRAREAHLATGDVRCQQNTPRASAGMLCLPHAGGHNKAETLDLPGSPLEIWMKFEKPQHAPKKKTRVKPSSTPRHSPKLTTRPLEFLMHVCATTRESGGVDSIGSSPLAFIGWERKGGHI